MIKKNNDRFDNLEEFIDNITRGGEVEFFFNNKKYSITQPKGRIAFFEQENEQSIIFFNDVNELITFKIDGEEIQNIVTIIQPFFRCF